MWHQTSAQILRLKHIKSLDSIYKDVLEKIKSKLLHKQQMSFVLLMVFLEAQRWFPLD